MIKTFEVVDHFKQHHSSRTKAQMCSSEQPVGSMMSMRQTQTYDLMCGKLSSSLLPVFLKICSAASATFSSSIFRQPNKDSKVSAE